MRKRKIVKELKDLNLQLLVAGEEEEIAKYFHMKTTPKFGEVAGLEYDPENDEFVRIKELSTRKNIYDAEDFLNLKD